MKQKLLVVLSCGVMMLGLVACGSNNKTSESNNAKTEEASTSTKSSTNEKQKLGKEPKRENFEDFDPEYQLAIVMKLFNDVTTKYDYAIGNPEYLLKDSMDQKAIDEMKKMLQEQAKNNDKIFKEEANQAITFLKQSKLKDKNGIQKLIDAENSYLKTAEQLIACLDSVTVDNAKQKREEMNALTKQYLKDAEKVGSTAGEVARNSGLNIETYQTTFKELMKK